MTLTLQATVENGQLKLSQPVALAEGTPVRVVITPLAEDKDPLEEVIGIADDGPPISLAERHDELLYGLKRDQGPPP